MHAASTDTLWRAYTHLPVSTGQRIQFVNTNIHTCARVHTLTSTHIQKQTSTSTSTYAYTHIRTCLHVFMVCTNIHTAVSKKVVIINSRYWNRKELWGSSSTNNLLLLAFNLHNIACRFIILPTAIH